MRSITSTEKNEQLPTKSKELIPGFRAHGVTNDFVMWDSVSFIWDWSYNNFVILLKSTSELWVINFMFCWLIYFFDSIKSLFNCLLYYRKPVHNISTAFNPKFVNYNLFHDYSNLCMMIKFKSILPRKFGKSPNSLDLL